jgi:hypothetical protein
MEPAGERREHGSQNLWRLTWANRSSCERAWITGLRAILSGLVKVQKRLLTCMRALPGLGHTTSALALMAVSHDDAQTAMSPHWSPPSNGGSTRVDVVPEVREDAAALEPAVEQREPSAPAPEMTP